MMKLASKTLSALLGLVLLGVLDYGACLALKNVLMASFANLDQQVVILAGMAAANLLLSALTIAGGMRWTMEMENKLRRYTERVELYTHWLHGLCQSLRNATRHDLADNGKVLQGSCALKKDMLQRRDIGFMKAFVDFWKSLGEAGYEGPHFPSLAVKVLFEMRKDIGQV